MTADEESADRLASDLSFFLGGAGTPLEPRVLRLPADEVTPFEELSPDAQTVGARLTALYHLCQRTDLPALVLSVRALYRKVLPRPVMERLARTLAVGQEVGRDDLARALDQLGYLSAPLVEDPGTFSVRGDLVDLFCPLYPTPVRLEFFGDTLESLRTFDPQTQRTLEPLSQLVLLPARELFLSEDTQRLAEAAVRAAAEKTNLPTSKVRERLEPIRERRLALGLEPLWPGFFPGGLGSVFDYLTGWADSCCVYLDDVLEQSRRAEELFAELERAHGEALARGELTCDVADHFLTREQAAAALSAFRTLEGGGLALTPGAENHDVALGSTQALRNAILNHHGEEGALTPLVEQLSAWREERIGAAIACGTAGQVDRVRRLLLERKVHVRTHGGPLCDPAKLYQPSVWVHLFTGEVTTGFVDAPGGFALLSDEEIFGARARRQTARRKTEASVIAAFRDLKEGDLVVHADFGVARYGGLVKMQVAGVWGDFLLLHYAGRDKVYLPVGRLRLVQKFTGADPEHATLDKLGSGSWEKTKRRVKEKLLQMAAELLRLYAARKAHPGIASSAPDRYFRQFEADFEFEATPDQQAAIDAVLADMQKPEPMDRLVCGDVGYGKTEVALRAAFKTVLDHRQVAVLVPTTVLAQQHLHTFRKRFAGYPVTIEAISRMRSATEVRQTLQRARAGKVDVLIGTHRLLATDVSFKELGLIVVDEEQRFGVKHKEQLKRLRTQVDVLTLTATPIPRTLNMAMSGVRDMSIIATPPQDRRAIRTFVVKFDTETIREAITREVARGGQVFFVHNRVQSIASMERLLRELVPNVSIGVAHGQMPEHRLERAMLDFVDKKFQVLLSTSIIESGLDIPSANTLIVNRADAFGLAQLYQLRGRVGRSHERAYAYLLVPARRTITRDAQRRLEVLQAFTELGAGFSIASHDLEIRGAGNFLGQEQSGAIEAIGFEMYTQLLDEAVHELRGEPLRQEVEPDVKLPLPAYLPDDYVPDVHQRLVLYKRLASAQTQEELDDLRVELVDRFGEPGDEVDFLCEVTALKLELRALRMVSLEAGPSRLVFGLGPQPALDPARLAAMVHRSGGAFRLTPDMKLVMRVPGGVAGPGLLAEAKKGLADLRRRAAAED